MRPRGIVTLFGRTGPAVLARGDGGEPGTHAQDGRAADLRHGVYRLPRREAPMGEAQPVGSDCETGTGQRPRRSGPTVRVKPGDPDNSYLWQKLQNKAAKGKGMPRGIFSTKRLPEAQLDVIRKWIEAGAPE